MIVTKKMWLTWDEEDNEEDNEFWTDKEPRRHNGIIEKGTELIPCEEEIFDELIMFKPKGKDNDFYGGPQFTIRELFVLIKDGTLELKGW